MYRALYRKWRPATFSDVVGQKSIVTALQNQLLHDKVGHAYLFTGTRGTGKTTCAKIFAKAVNCPSRNGADPCGVCPVCKGIDDGSVLDVVEIDAASNNGVDNIRDLRDETAYTPSTATYKVYIIDEVHMLSTAAFNALLKIMEEPPSHVIFILATTEIHKVPATIVSRCQRYDFTRITPEDIAGRLQYVAQEENLALEPDAAGLIARLADGALRDALSILDTCAGVTDSIDTEVVRRMAGVTDKSYLFTLSDAVAHSDAPQALALVAQLREKSIDIKRLCDELILHYRNLLLAGVAGGASLLTGVSTQEEQRYLAGAAGISQAQAVRAIQTLCNALDKMGKGTDPRIELELALFRLCTEPAAFVNAAAVQAAAVAAPVPPMQTYGNVQAAAPLPKPEQTYGSVHAAGSGSFGAAPAAPKAPEPAEEDVPWVTDEAPGRDPFARQPQEADEEDMPDTLPTQKEPEDMPEEPAVQAPATPWTPVEKPTAESKVSHAAIPNSAQPAPIEPGVFTAWDAVLEAMKGKDGLLYANMRNSKAYYDGKRVLIDGSDLFLEYMRKNEYSAGLIRSTIAEVTGVKCAIGPYKKQVSAVHTADVAQQSLEHLSQMGVPVEYQDE